MKLCILSANLGNFDKPIKPVEQELPNGIDLIEYHCFTDADFPPITGLTPRLQYRIPKLFGWQMKPGFDYYLWLDGSMSLTRPDCVRWFMDQLADGDIALFKHPWRHTIEQEVDHIEEYLLKGDRYITSRYKNGLHKEQLADIKLNKDFTDNTLYASTTFIYRDSAHIRDVMRLWWLHQSRYYTCDQVVLPYVVRDSDVRILSGNLFKHDYIELVSKHD